MTPARHLIEAIDDGAQRGDWWALLESFEAAAVWAVPHDADTAAVLLGATRALAAGIGYAYEGGFHEPDFVVEPTRDISGALGPERAPPRRTARRRHAPHRGRRVRPSRARRRRSRTRRRPEHRPAPSLTKRERELLALVAEGLTDNQIAEKLFISLRTVRSHLDRIRDKSGCRRRAELTRLAVSAQLT